MTFTIPEGLAPELYPLAWLVGRWRGEGVVGYPCIEEQAFTQDVSFTHDGGPYLAYTSTVRLVVAPDDVAELTDPGSSIDTVEPGPVWSTESGYWRVPPERPDGLADGQFPVEILLADPSGHLSLYIGVVGNGRIEVASDLIARTASASEVTAGKRLFGLVRGELMWAFDLAAFGYPMQSYASAHLARVSDGSVIDEGNS
jgi:hypothetical protein